MKEFFYKIWTMTYDIIQNRMTSYRVVWRHPKSLFYNINCCLSRLMLHASYMTIFRTFTQIAKIQNRMTSHARCMMSSKNLKSHPYAPRIIWRNLDLSDVIQQSKPYNLFLSLHDYMTSWRDVWHHSASYANVAFYVNAVPYVYVTLNPQSGTKCLECQDEDAKPYQIRIRYAKSNSHAESEIY